MNLKQELEAGALRWAEYASFRSANPDLGSVEDALGICIFYVWALENMEDSDAE